MPQTAPQTRAAHEAEIGISILRQALRPATEAALVDRMTHLALIHLLAAKRVAAGEAICPGCSGRGLSAGLAARTVAKCTSCGGLFTTRPILGVQALEIVDLSGHMLAKAGPAGAFYFDLDVTSDGRTHRVHGWADRATRRVTQWG